MLSQTRIFPVARGDSHWFSSETCLSSQCLTERHVHCGWKLILIFYSKTSDSSWHFYTGTQECHFLPDRSFHIWIIFSWDSCQVSALWLLSSVTYWQALRPLTCGAHSHLFLTFACLVLLLILVSHPGPELFCCPASQRTHISNFGGSVHLITQSTKTILPLQHMGQILL